VLHRARGFPAAPFFLPIPRGFHIASAMASKPALRTELLLNLALLAAVALLLGAVTSLLISTVAPERLFPLVLMVVVLDILIFIVFGRYLVTRSCCGRWSGSCRQRMRSWPEIWLPGAGWGDSGLRHPGERLNRMTDHLLDAQSQLVRSESWRALAASPPGLRTKWGIRLARSAPTWRCCGDAAPIPK